MPRVEQNAPSTYLPSLCPDVYDTFSNEIQAFVDKDGGEVSDNATKARVEQWILKVE
jgi:hypothetical protein